MKGQYIKAVLMLLRDGQNPEVVLSGLKKTLENRGHAKLYAQILQGVTRELSASTKNPAPRIVVAKNDDTEKLKTAINQAMSELKAEGEPVVSIDSTIVGGFIASFEDQMLDNSYKSKLLKWYRQTLSTK